MIKIKTTKIVSLGDAKRLTHGVGFGAVELNNKPIQPAL